MDKISQHFSRSEFKCKCGKCNKIAVDHELLVILEDLRNWFNEPIKITSGNRCEDHNKAIGGVAQSRHLDSIAADIQVKDVTTFEVYRYLDSKYPDKYGIGLYPTWVHIDVRPERARWEK